MALYPQKIKIEHDVHEKYMREVYGMLGIKVKGPWRSYNTVDPELVVELARLHNTNTNIATITGISVDTLMRHFTFHIMLGKALADNELAYEQYKKMKEGNVPMLQWLGKAWLKQNEKDVGAEQDHEGDVKEFLRILKSEAPKFEG